MEAAGASIARGGVGLLKVWIRAEHNILDGDAENAGLENAGLENVGPNRRSGKGRTGKRGNIMCMGSEM